MQNNSISLKDFFIICVEIVDRLLPTLPPAEQILTTQFLFRTIAAGRTDCTISAEDLCILTGFVPATLRKALSGLIARNIVTIIDPGNSWRCRTYRFNLPLQILESHLASDPLKLARDPDILYRSFFSGSGPSLPVSENKETDLLSRLSAEDIRKVNMIFSSLSKEELLEYKLKASKTLSPGENIELKIKELIARSCLGAEYLHKYIQEQ